MVGHTGAARFKDLNCLTVRSVLQGPRKGTDSEWCLHKTLSQSSSKKSRARQGPAFPQTVSCLIVCLDPNVAGVSRPWKVDVENTKFPDWGDCVWQNREGPRGS